MEIRSDKERLDIISEVKALLLIVGEEKDAGISILLDQAYSYATAYTGAQIIPSSLLCRMVCEDYSRAPAVTKKVRAGMSEEYVNGYSTAVCTLLKSMRRLKTL